MISESDLFGMFDRSLSRYDELKDKYAAVETALPQEELPEESEVAESINTYLTNLWTMILESFG